MKTTLRAARTYTGLTTDEVAKIVGWSRNTLQGYEKDPSKANVDKLNKLCEVYGISLNDLDLRPEAKIFEDFKHYKEGGPVEFNGEQMQD